MQPIRAFTSVEVAMACVLIAVTMGIGYMGLASVRQLSHEYRSRQEWVLDILRTEVWLTSDLRSCNDIIFVDSSMMLAMRLDTVVYTQAEGRLTRLRSATQDTLLRGVRSINIIHGGPDTLRIGCRWMEVVVDLSGLSEHRALSITKHLSAQEMISDHGGPDR